MEKYSYTRVKILNISNDDDITVFINLTNIFACIFFSPIIIPDNFSILRAFFLEKKTQLIEAYSHHRIEFEVICGNME